MGEHNWPILRRHVPAAVAVADAFTCEAMRWLWAEHGLRTEPSGAIAVAAALQGAVDLDGEGDVAIVVSGRNVDEESFRRWTEAGPVTFTANELARFETFGFVVLRGFLGREELAAFGAEFDLGLARPRKEMSRKGGRRQLNWSNLGPDTPGLAALLEGPPFRRGGRTAVRPRGRRALRQLQLLRRGSRRSGTPTPRTCAAGVGWRSCAVGDSPDTSIPVSNPSQPATTLEMKNLNRRNYPPDHGIRVPAGEIDSLLVRLFEKVGMPGDDAGLLAGILTRNNRRCIYSHGTGQVPYYLQKIKDGDINPRPRITTVSEAPRGAGDGWRRRPGILPVLARN